MVEINIENPFHINANIDVNAFANKITGMPNGSRSDFTKGVVNHFTSLGYNVFVCHPNHMITGPYAKTHHEVRINLFSTIGFDVYVMARGRSVTATNCGDGGYDNWSFGGNCNVSDKTVRPFGQICLINFNGKSNNNITILYLPPIVLKSTIISNFIMKLIISVGKSSCSNITFINSTTISCFIGPLILNNTNQQLLQQQQYINVSINGKSGGNYFIIYSQNPNKVYYNNNSTENNNGSNNKINNGKNGSGDGSEHDKNDNGSIFKRKKWILPIVVIFGFIIVSSLIIYIIYKNKKSRFVLYFKNSFEDAKRNARIRRKEFKYRSQLKQFNKRIQEENQPEASSSSPTPQSPPSPQSPQSPPLQPLSPNQIGKLPDYSATPEN
ncbi:hypothetical protein ACTA71_000320 [Dictyostelium dimigraforme]